jgi:hypothetical protein
VKSSFGLRGVVRALAQFDYNSRVKQGPKGASACGPRKRRRASVCGDGGDYGLSTLSGIVRHYITNYRDGAGDELGFFVAQPTLLDAVSRAALAEGPDGKRLAHQRRIPRRVLEESARFLEAALPRLTAAATFEALHEVVREEIGGVRGIGRLAVYDTALRIAARRGLEPSRVYLHAGTRAGARRLGLDVACESLAVADLPAPLRQLRPREIEDVLCIYKDELGTP